MHPPHLSSDPRDDADRAARDRMTARVMAAHAALSTPELEAARRQSLDRARKELACALHSFRAGDDGLGEDAVAEAWSATWAASLADMELRRRTGLGG
jgi:hypothetical protein